jgi:hypothetical protein
MTVEAESASYTAEIFTPDIANVFLGVLRTSSEDKPELDLRQLLDIATSFAVHRAELLGRQPIPSDVEYVLTIFCRWPLKPPPSADYRSVVQERLETALIEGDLNALTNSILEVALVLSIEMLLKAQTENRTQWLFVS